MQIKIFICSSLIFFSLCGVSESNQICDGDYIKMSFMGGRLGKVSIIYDRKGTVTFGPENDAVLETRQIDPKQLESYWLIAEDVTKNVEPGEYGIITSRGKSETDIKISICDKINSYTATNKRKGARFSDTLLKILDKRPR